MQLSMLLGCSTLALALVSCGGKQDASDTASAGQGGGTTTSADLPAPTPDPSGGGIPDTPSENMNGEPGLDIEHGYGPRWHVGPFWSGEYPEGFSVLEADITVPARSQMSPNTPHDLSCALEQFAVYQPWNVERAMADDVVFASASKILTLSVIEPRTLDVWGGEESRTLTLNAGDTILWLHYLSEGYFRARINGETFELNVSDVAPELEAVEAEAEQHEWVELDCANGVRGWLWLDEVRTAPGIGGWFPTSYGEASDLSPEDAEALRNAPDDL